jgi:hypothetical protein
MADTTTFGNDTIFAFAPGFVQAKPGQKNLKIPVLISQGGGIAFDFKLKFNPDVFTNLRVEKGERACGGLWDEKNPDVLQRGDWGVFGNQIYDEYNVCMYQAGDIGFVTGGEAAVVVCDVKDNVTEGVYTLDLASALINEVPVDTMDGFVVVFKDGNDPQDVYQSWVESQQQNV